MKTQTLTILAAVLATGSFSPPEQDGLVKWWAVFTVCQSEATDKLVELGREALREAPSDEQAERWRGMLETQRSLANAGAVVTVYLLAEDLVEAEAVNEQIEGLDGCPHGELEAARRAIGDVIG